MGTKNNNEADWNEKERQLPSGPAGGTVEPWDEGALVLGCLAKDRAAQTTLVLGYAQWIHAGAIRSYHKAGKPSSCEPRDLVHRFFVQVFTDPFAVLDRFDQSGRSGKLGPFLAMVAFYRCLKMLKASDLSMPASACAAGAIDWQAIPDHPHEIPINPDNLLRQILAELSDTTRDILQRRLGIGPYRVQHSVREIAQKLGCTTRQVYYRIAKMRGLRRKVIARLQRDNSDEFA